MQLSERAVARHRANHLVREDESEEIDLTPVVGADGKVSDVGLLDLLIEKGGQTLKLKTVKVSPELALKAMELKYKLTQGNVFQDFMDAFSGVNEEMVAAESEAAGAVSDEDEQAQSADPE